MKHLRNKMNEIYLVHFQWQWVEERDSINHLMVRTSWGPKLFYDISGLSETQK
jgi:hypothetical protein